MPRQKMKARNVKIKEAKNTATTQKNLSFDFIVYLSLACVLLILKMQVLRFDF